MLFMAIKTSKNYSETKTPEILSYAGLIFLGKIFLKIWNSEEHKRQKQNKEEKKTKKIVERDEKFRKIEMLLWKKVAKICRSW